ncbi:hypothetical protein PVAND_012737 [Polypedilum vanderplanki]|uniref:Ionotropic receptor n=1 Tax=Polypedilum vanderplanki TaxID=319348 RepID=A0A9J6CME3_POLVA|nr:hypothetical protein PVAND_012737 [Polypedilum vanderplanki]
MNVFMILFASLFVSIRCDKSKILQNKQRDELMEAFFEAFLLSANFSARIIGRTELFEQTEFSSLHVPYELWCTDFFTANKTEINSLSPSFINSVLFANNQEIFTIFSRENLKFFRLDGFYMLLSYSECSKNDDKIFEHLWKRQIFNVNLICKLNMEIFMTTFFPYQNSSCGTINSLVINKFSNHSWINKVIFPEKFKNLYNCQLRVASFYYSPITMREDLGNGTFRYYGSEMEILSGLAEALNFQINHNYVPASGMAGILLENGTSTGLLKQTIEGEMDMLMGFYYLTYLRTKFLSFSQSHYSVPLVIMIPLGKPYTPFEKLFNPLQFMVWIFLLITIILGLACIGVVNCQNDKIKNFVFGKDIRDPYMNFLNILLNGFQTKLPKRTFARTILMMFMMFCFILRTLYQGSLFQFLQSDDRNPEMATIDEMIEKNCIFYVRETLEHNIKNMSFYKKRKVVKYAEYPALIKRTRDSDFNGGIIMPLLEVITANQQTYRNYTYKVLKEYLFDVQIVCYFPKNFHLIDIINEKIAILKAAGLISMWMDKYVDKTFINIKPDTPGPKRLNIEHLYGGFELLFYGIIISVIAFFIEIINANISVKLFKNKSVNKKNKTRRQLFTYLD